MTQGFEENYGAHNNATIILSTDERASIGDERGRGPPTFLHPAQTGRQGSILLDLQWQQRASLSRLMIATQ
jgi:hypothetical protein